MTQVNSPGSRHIYCCAESIHTKKISTDHTG